MGDMCKWSVGTSQNTVHFSNINTVISADHDGIQCGRGALEVDKEPPLVTSRFNGSSEHMKTQAFLRASLFGVVGLFLVLTAKQHGSAKHRKRGEQRDGGQWFVLNNRWRRRVNGYVIEHRWVDFNKQWSIFS